MHFEEVDVPYTVELGEGREQTLPGSLYRFQLTGTMNCSKRPTTSLSATGDGLA